MKLFTVTLMLAAAGCGGMSGMSMSGDSSAMRSYGTLGTNMSATLAAYAASTASMTDDAACSSAHASYAQTMASMIARMRDMSAAMDDHMMRYGDAQPGADMACITDALDAELSRHHEVACLDPDISSDKAETALHVGIMTNLLHHQLARYEAVGATMGMMQSPPDATWSCQHNADGSFTIGGAPWTPGSPLDLGTSGTIAPEAWPMPCDGSCGGCSGADLGMGSM